MSGREPEPVERLVEAVLASPSYGRLCTDFVRRVGEKELAKRRRLKEALKATKAKLHQVAGAYQELRPRYALWLEQLRQAHQGGKREDFLATCRQIMGHHASTRERLPILEQFYGTVLAAVTPLHTVLDVACGLNPLALPWMLLAPPDAGEFGRTREYYAYDVDRDLMDFLGQFLALLGVGGEARVEDVTRFRPSQPADLALVLKALPGLERLEPGAARRLLAGLPARYLLVSFPVRSLGGQAKGMAAHYEAQFRKWLDPSQGVVQRWEFATELAFLVSR